MAERTGKDVVVTDESAVLEGDSVVEVEPLLPDDARLFINGTISAEKFVESRRLQAENYLQGSRLLRQTTAGFVRRVAIVTSIGYAVTASILLFSRSIQTAVTAAAFSVASLLAVLAVSRRKPAGSHAGSAPGEERP